MPLLLGSTFQHFKGLKRFEPFLSDAKVACVTTAALCQIDDDSNRPDWIVGEIDAIKTKSGDFFEYDLREKTWSDLIRDLTACDLIYFIGGNTYCLLEHVNKSGFRDFLKNFLNDGKSIWGGSAGAIIHCPDIDYIASMDEPEKANLDSTKGLALTLLSIMPHWQTKHHDAALECLRQNPDLDILCLTDDQAVYVDGNIIEII